MIGTTKEIKMKYVAAILTAVFALTAYASDAKKEKTEGSSSVSMGRSRIS